MIYWLNPAYAWWLAPIVGALIVSIPVSVLVSRVGVGALARRRGLFRTPQESHAPPELVELNAYLTAAAQRDREMIPAQRDGFVRGIVDPFVNALHRCLLRGPRSVSAALREKRAALVERALVEGPAAIGVRARKILMADAECVDELHRRVWELPSEDRARAWGVTPPPSAPESSS